MRIQQILCLASLLVGPYLQAATLSVSGIWSPTVGVTDLATGAGSDIRTPLHSETIYLQLAGTGGGNWTLSVSRSGTGQPDDVQMAIRQLWGGGCTLQGGQTFKQISTLATQLLTGTGDCAAIAVQIQLEGVSVRHGPLAFTSTIHYTVSVD